MSVSSCQAVQVPPCHISNSEVQLASTSQNEVSSRHPLFTAYKRVDRKVKPVPAVFPEDAKVTRQFPEDPLKTLPKLSANPPEFKSGNRLTLERLKELNINEIGFL